MTPGDLYRTCRISARRLEARQHYLVPGDEARQEAFHAGRSLPAPGESKAADLRLIADLHRSGRQVDRVHVVERPLTAYVRYEMAVYRENSAAGEDIRIADRSRHPDLVDLTEDFAVFDAESDDASVIVFDYDPEGRLLSYRHVTDPVAVGGYWRQYLVARRWSVPLDEFVADA